MLDLPEALSLINHYLIQHKGLKVTSDEKSISIVTKFGTEIPLMIIDVKNGEVLKSDVDRLVWTLRDYGGEGVR